MAEEGKLITSIALSPEQRERMYGLRSKLGLNRSHFIVVMLDFVEANWDLFQEAFFREIELYEKSKAAYEKWRETRSKEDLEKYTESVDEYEKAWKIKE